MKKKVKFLGYTPKTRKFLQGLYSEYEISDSAGIKLLEVIGGSLFIYGRIVEMNLLIPHDQLII